MPVLPGDAQPLELRVSSGRAKGKAKGAAKSKTNKRGGGGGGPGPGETPGTPKARKRKGDDELIQLDLKRDQLNLRRHAEPWW